MELEASSRCSTRHQTMVVRMESASRNARAGSGRRVVVAGIPGVFTSWTWLV
jgi:hypothetical protein